MIVNLITAVERLYFGKCSDIVTSQILLAERDTVDQCNFYDLALRSPSDYLDPCLPHTDPSRQETYAKNPIYGTSFEYIGDMLRDEKYNVRDGRKQQTVIVDDVDNQFIDDILSSVRLSSPTAGLKEFNLLFMVIWNRLKLQLSSYGELVTIQQRMYSMKQDYTLCNVLNNMHDVQQTAGRDETDTCLSLLWMQLASSHFFRQHEEVAVKYGFTEQLRRDFSAVDAHMRQLLASDNLDIFNLLMFLSHPTMNLIKAKSKIALYRFERQQMTFVQRFKDGQAFQEALGDHMAYDFVFLKQENQPLQLLVPIAKTLGMQQNNLKTSVLRQIQKHVFSVCHVDYTEEDLLQYADAEDEDSYQVNDNEKSTKPPNNAQAQSTYSAANDDSDKILEENATQQYVADFTKAIIRKQCRHWVLSAWDALLLCEENVHYLQKNDEIKIVDLATGTILDNTVAERTAPIPRARRQPGEAVFIERRRCWRCGRRHQPGGTRYRYQAGKASDCQRWTARLHHI